MVPQGKAGARANDNQAQAQAAITQQRLDTVDPEYETQLDEARARVARARAEMDTASRFPTKRSRNRMAALRSGCGPRPTGGRGGGGR
jgi:hypothetical protein